METRTKKTAKKAAPKKKRAATAEPQIFYLDAWLRYLKVTPDELAEKLGLDRTTIWRYRAGKQQPQKGLLPKIAEALGIETADLWRPPGVEPKLIDLNQAATHITDNEARQRLADFIRSWKP